MAADLKPIRTEADCDEALIEVERLWGAKSGTLKGDRLDILAPLIDAYETEAYPMDPPDPVEAIRFRMEQQGLTRKDLEPMIGPRKSGGGCAQPETEPVYRNDTTTAFPSRHLGRYADPAKPSG